MPRVRLQMLLAALLLGAALLGLSGCQRRDTAATPTPATHQQFVPAVGGGTSPLPTPGAADSPVKP